MQRSIANRPKKRQLRKMPADHSHSVLVYFKLISFFLMKNWKIAFTNRDRYVIITLLCIAQNNSYLGFAENAR